MFNSFAFFTREKESPKPTMLSHCCSKRLTSFLLNVSFKWMFFFCYRISLLLLVVSNYISLLVISVIDFTLWSISLFPFGKNPFSHLGKLESVSLVAVGFSPLVKMDFTHSFVFLPDRPFLRVLEGKGNFSAPF